MSGGKYHRIFEWNKFHDAPGTAIAFSPDGLLMVTGGSDGLLALFELSSGRALHLVQFPVQVQIICLFWSSVGEIFVGTSGHHLISLTWHREASAFTTSYIPFDFDDAISAVTFTSEGSMLAVAYGHKVEIWKRNTGEWQPHKFIVISDWGYIYDVFFNGKDCLLVGCDQALVMWRFLRDPMSVHPLGGIVSPKVDRSAFIYEDSLVGVAHEGNLQLYQMASTYPNDLVHITGWAQSAEGAQAAGRRRVRTALALERMGGTTAIVWSDLHGDISIAHTPLFGRSAAKPPMQVLKLEKTKRVVDTLKTFRHEDSCYIAAIYSVKNQNLPNGGTTSIELWKYSYASVELRVITPSSGIPQKEFSDLLEEGIKSSREQAKPTKERSEELREAKAASWQSLQSSFNMLQALLDRLKGAGQFVLANGYSRTIAACTLALVGIAITSRLVLGPSSSPNPATYGPKVHRVRLPGPIIICFAMGRWIWDCLVGMTWVGLPFWSWFAGQYARVLEVACDLAPEFCT